MSDRHDRALGALVGLPPRHGDMVRRDSEALQAGLPTDEAGRRENGLGRVITFVTSAGIHAPAGGARETEAAR